MAVTYGQDLRDRVLAAYDRGMQTKEVAETFGVSPAWARRVKQRRRESGRTTAFARGGQRFVKIDLERLAQLVEEQPDATLLELRDRLGIKCRDSSISRALARLGMTFKKKRSTHPSRIVPTLPSGVASGRPARDDKTPVG